MANTLTGLLPTLYEAVDVVSREMVGFIPACTIDAKAESAALNQSITVPITPAAAAEDSVPGQLPPDTGDQAIGNTQITITKSKAVPFRWTGEEQKGVNNGVGYKNIRRDQISQAIRTLVNLVDADLASTFTRASRAWGTAGTAPFASDLSDPANVRKILMDNGAPMSDLQLVIDTTAGAKVRSLAQLTKANEAGTNALREQGVLLDIHGFKLRESAGVMARSAVGTGTGYKLNGAHAKGATTINVQTGTGTILAGDVVTIGNNKYVVATALSAGSLTIGLPGLVDAQATGGNVTVSAIFTPNYAFDRSALVLAARQRAIPEEGDSADDRAYITDPVSGLTFEFAMYTQYMQVRYEVALAWGVANIKPNHSALLLG